MEKILRGHWDMSTEAQPPWFSTVEQGNILHALIRTDSVMEEEVVDRIEALVSTRLKPGTAVLIDLTSTVRRVSTRFLNMLVSLQRQARVHGGMFAVCGVLPEISELLQITRLNRHLAIFDESPQAYTRLESQGSWSAGRSDMVGLATTPMDGLFRLFAKLSGNSAN